MSDLQVIIKPSNEERAFFMELGDRIRKLRKELGMSQAELAKKIGMHPRQLPRYEIGTGKPSIDTLKKLARYLEVSSDYLLFGEDNDLKRRTKIEDPDLLHLFQRIDRFKKPVREKLKWGIESFLSNVPEENFKFSEHPATHSLVKSS